MVSRRLPELGALRGSECDMVSRRLLGVEVLGREEWTLVGSRNSAVFGPVVNPLERDSRKALLGRTRYSVLIGMFGSWW